MDRALLKLLERKDVQQLEMGPLLSSRWKGTSTLVHVGLGLGLKRFDLSTKFSEIFYFA